MSALRKISARPRHSANHCLCVARVIVKVGRSTQKSAATAHNGSIFSLDGPRLAESSMFPPDFSVGYSGGGVIPIPTYQSLFMNHL
jgi:hypothetical protein